MTASRGRVAGAELAVGRGWRRWQRDGYGLYVDRELDEPLLFARSVAAGLEDEPRWLPCRYLYDETGSALYERITRQPEYYLTRAEARILAAHAGAVRRRVGQATLVELGSGTSSKTRHLLDEWTAAGHTDYVPIDVNITALESACRQLAAAYPGLGLAGIAATYERGLPVAAQRSPLLLLFLGSSVGNFNDAELDAFLRTTAACLSPGDTFLLGIDLVKDVQRLEAAYNDAAGWTARFTCNLFARMNRELGTRVPLDAVEHVAYYNDRRERIEIYARFLQEVEVELAAIGRRYRIARGEMVLVEISRKFRIERMAAEVGRFGFTLEAAFTDPEGLFADLLLRRCGDAPVPGDRGGR